ncbi:hypothetical protein MJO29_011841 [Puccinia striiformis f. sp. tritici]|nr:hypothetical protein MJO29_011841 [Puccinia striiformis f. sp. tritici]
MGMAASDEPKPDEESLVVATDVVCDCLCTDGCHAAELASDEPRGVCAEFHHQVEGCLARILLDTGAGSSYVSTSFVSDSGSLISCSAESFKVTGAFGNRISDDRLATVRFKFAEESFAWQHCPVTTLSWAVIGSLPMSLRQIGAPIRGT